MSKFLSWLRLPVAISLLQLLLFPTVKAQLSISVPFPPSYVTIAGKATLTYEVVVSNQSKSPFRMVEFNVANDAGEKIKTLESGALSNAISAATKPTGKLSIHPNTSKILYVEIAIDKNQLFDSLVQTVVATDSISGNVVRAKATTSINKQPLITLGPPLKNGPWAAVYNADWERGHRRVAYTKDSVSRIPGRFAIDFIRLDANGKYAKGDEDIITNWYGYGADVLAVAAGEIISTRTDFTESKTISEHPHYTSEKATGNYISLKIDSQHYAFYEHLMPNSILVAPGQRVSKGQVIAKLGFTGQTTGPHLHLHVADRNSPLGAEGVPYVFEKLTTVGAYSDFSKFGKTVWTQQKSSRVHHEFPASNTVIRFE